MMYMIYKHINNNQIAVIKRFAILVLCRVYLMIQMQMARPIFRSEHCLTLWHHSFSESFLTVDVLETTIIYGLDDFPPDTKTALYFVPVIS